MKNPAEVQTIKTASGSTYEHDLSNGRIRRLEGTHNPTPRQGADGDWLPYEAIHGPLKEAPLVVLWSHQHGRMTVTSPVVSYTNAEEREVEESAPIPEAQTRPVA